MNLGKHIAAMVLMIISSCGWSQISCDSILSKKVAFNYKAHAIHGKAPDALKPGMILMPTSVVYNLGKPSFMEQYKDSLKIWAGIITKHENLVFEIAVHTGTRGSDELNKKLSEGRAALIYDYLIKDCHVSSCNLRFAGYGETQLLEAEDNGNTKIHDGSGHVNNNRTELRIIAYKK